ncbi:MAG TPA: hypothetical protein VHP63_07315 [candidate division Zixibacteria bacterium]|nr:hypothetical protein [candidate division Zixibacteria bacterium]
MRRILISFIAIGFVFLLALGCSEDEPTAPVPAVLAKILILEDGGTQDSLFKILDSAGFDVTLGGHYSDYTGTNFSTYNLVILLDGFVTGYTMADSIQTALKNYVQSGGVLLTTDWFNYYANNVIVDSISPLEYGGNYGDGAVERYVKELDHPITAGVPDTFDTYQDWTWIQAVDKANSLSTNRQVLFSGFQAGSTALGIGTYGSGRIIHWAMAGVDYGPNIWSPEVRRIFINIAAFSKTI